METKISQYSVEPFTLISHAYAGSYPGYCAVSSFSRGSAATVTRRNVLGESKSLVKGDGIHATPFSGTYRECVPVSGDLSSTYRNTNASGPDKQVCGDRAGTYATTNVAAGYVFALNDPLPVAPDPALEKRLRDASETKALAALSKGYYNLGIILAERRRSISYLTDKAKQLTRLIKDKQLSSLARYNRSKRHDRHEMARQISNEHLAFMFGLLPMIDEIKGIADKIASEKTLVITGRGRQAKDAFDDSYQRIRSVSLSGYGPMSADCKSEKLTRYSVRSGIVVDVKVEALQQMREHGLNPIATFYDIVPLSFLLDFVSNTGTFLRAYEPVLGVEFRTAYSTLWRESKLAMKISGTTYVVQSPSSVETVRTQGFAEGYCRYLYVQRFPLTEMPTPTWLVQNNMSLAKAATLASLAIQRYLKPVKAIIKQRPFRYRGPRPPYLPPIKYR